MSGLAAGLGAVDGLADRFMADRHVPGLAYGVVRGGELVHARGLGTLRVGEAATPDADSVFRIASMTKSFTAATILALRDEGRLGLDDLVARHVPELADLRGPTADSPPLTVRHLLTMSSGLATDDPWGDRQQGLDLAAFRDLLRGQLSFAWPPGTRFEYSNLGYGILGRLITNVAGREYREVVGDRLLRPLGLTATTYERVEVPPDRLALGYLWRDDRYELEPIDGYGALASMGGIFTSVRDLARWIGFLADAWPPRDEPERGSPLSRASRREQQTPATLIGADVIGATLGAPIRIVAAAYAMGLFVEQRRDWGTIVSHSGGYPGYGSNMAWLPASGLGLVVLTNHRYGWARQLGGEMLTALVAADAVPARRLRPAAPTVAARRDVKGLLAGWDDARAARIFAMNVELDEPLERRRAAIEHLAEVHGPLEPDPELPERHDTSLHAAWWLRGRRGGRVRIELRLDPESPPKIQTFAVTSVPEPAPALTAIAAGVVTAIAAAEVAVATIGTAASILPADLELAPTVDAAALGRAVRIAAAGWGPLVLGPVVAGDGRTTATWRLRGPDVEFELSVTLDPESGLVTALDLRPRLAEGPELAI